MTTDNPDLRRKSFYDHPKCVEMATCGITSQDIIERSLLVYLHLIEVQFWYDVDVVPVPSKQLVFLKGRRTKQSEELEYVLPLSSNCSFTLGETRDFIDSACDHGCLSDGVVLAFVDTSSIVVYHKVTRGLVPPPKLTNQEILKMNRVTEWNHKKGTWRTYTKKTS